MSNDANQPAIHKHNREDNFDFSTLRECAHYYHLKCTTQIKIIMRIVVNAVHVGFRLIFVYFRILRTYMNA